MLLLPGGFVVLVLHGGICAQDSDTRQHLPTSRYRSRIDEGSACAMSWHRSLQRDSARGSAFCSLGSRALPVSLSQRPWFAGCVRGKRTFDEGLECSFCSIEGQGIANETMGGVMIQVNSAQFPHKLVRIEIAPEFPGCNHFVHELGELAAPPFFHGEEPLTDEIGLGSVVEFEHAGSNRTRR